ncbi:MAG: GtrA family protein [Patescibacteria group bacterium]|nr:GtrA family protein [Patescibacteria group bacterium]
MKKISFEKATKNKVVGEGKRYVIFGLIVTAIDFILLFILKELLLFSHYLVAAAISFLIATSISYYFNMRHVFKGYYDSIIKLRLYVVFLVITGVGLLINEAIMFRLTEGFGWYYLSSKIIASAIVIFWNFLAKKLFLFSDWAILKKYKFKPKK